MNKNLLDLIDAICTNFMEAFPGRPWSPRIDENMQWITHCNSFVNGVARHLGYTAFWTSVNPMMANEMYDFLTTSKDWTAISGEVAQTHANNGGFVIAAQSGQLHGHVNVVRPGNMVMSGKWNKLVPVCCNVGASVDISKGENWAFETEPKYFVLNSTLNV